LTFEIRDYGSSIGASSWSFTYPWK
jgi:hypothetical protein